MKSSSSKKKSGMNVSYKFSMRDLSFPTPPSKTIFRHSSVCLFVSYTIELNRERERENREETLNKLSFSFIQTKNYL